MCVYGNLRWSLSETCVDMLRKAKLSSGEKIRREEKNDMKHMMMFRSELGQILFVLERLHHHKQLNRWLYVNNWRLLHQKCKEHESFTSNFLCLFPLRFTFPTQSRFYFFKASRVRRKMWCKCNVYGLSHNQVTT